MKIILADKRFAAYLTQVEGIVFIKEKINFLASVIDDELEKTTADTLTRNKQRFREFNIPLVEGDTLTVTTDVKVDAAWAQNPLIFNFDSLVIDLKRYIEFSLQLLLTVTRGYPEKKFSLDNLLQDVRKEKTPPKKTSTLIEQQFPQLWSCLSNHSDWFRRMNGIRTTAIHSKAINAVEGFKVTVVWDSLNSIEKGVPKSKGISLQVERLDIKSFIEESRPILKQFSKEITESLLASIEAHPGPVKQSIASFLRHPLRALLTPKPLHSENE